MAVWVGIDKKGGQGQIFIFNTNRPVKDKG